MCDICHRYPCDPRCPNAPEPAGVYECAHCNEAIRIGELYYQHDGKYYHEECYHDAAPALAANAMELVFVEATDTDEEVEIGTCKHCNEPVLTYEDRWAKDTLMYHHECLMDSAGQMLGHCALIAEDIFD